MLLAFENRPPDNRLYSEFTVRIFDIPELFESRFEANGETGVFPLFKVFDP